jgi:Domain of unknown function (DUF3597)
MSILGDIISKVFSHASAAATAPASSSAPASKPPTAPDGSPAPASQPAAATPVDVTAILDKLASQSKEKLDWRHSIVDMMKLLNLDSSLGARKHLAEELHYTGNTNDSASMNIWLHGQVMTKLAENGGKVPDDLKG